jgi:hypothetical protein
MALISQDGEPAKNRTDGWAAEVNTALLSSAVREVATNGRIGA